MKKWNFLAKGSTFVTTLHSNWHQFLIFHHAALKGVHDAGNTYQIGKFVPGYSTPKFDRSTFLMSRENSSCSVPMFRANTSLSAYGHQGEALYRPKASSTIWTVKMKSFQVADARVFYALWPDWAPFYFFTELLLWCGIYDLLDLPISSRQPGRALRSFSISRFFGVSLTSALHWVEKILHGFPVRLPVLLLFLLMIKMLTAFLLSLRLLGLSPKLYPCL